MARRPLNPLLVLCCRWIARRLHRGENSGAEMAGAYALVAYITMVDEGKVIQTTDKIKNAIEFGERMHLEEE